MAEGGEGAHDSDNKAQDIESRIKSAMLSRASYFSDQADSLTFEGVRRLLEKDLGLETHALDSHKRFVKQWLQTCIESASADKPPKSEDEVKENDVPSTEGEAKPVDKLETKKEAEEPISEDVGKMEDSPVMGLMTGSKRVKTDTDSAGDTKSKVVPKEITIKKAVRARASYLRENSENITLAGLRRLLEEDLGLEKHALDPFKALIKQQVDEALESPDIPQTTGSDKKKNLKKNAQGKVASKSSKEETPASSGSESDDQEDEKVRKKSVPKGKLQQSDAIKKRKRVEDGKKGATRKQSKVSKASSEGRGEEDGGGVSEDGDSEASAEKPTKKKDVSKPSYGKQVERLKTVIKLCGLSVPPSIYKKVKQAPENKREACLIKELEDVLAKEGLSSNPSEKEIKDVKKRKEKARELEGIDLSNIVSSSRRRSTTSFAPPPKPKIPELSESESEDSENEDEEDEEDEEVQDEEVDEEEENGGNGSQSEESEEEEEEADNGDSD